MGRAGALALIAVVAASASCARAIEPIGPDAQVAPDVAVLPPQPVDQIDLVFEIDDSNSMLDTQANLMAEVAPFLQYFLSPPCVSPTNPTPHTCDPSVPTDRLAFAPLRGMHVGIVSTDLGTPGSTVPGCVASERGDDGLLNPIHYGPAMQQHEPTPGSPTAAPPGFRPADCTDPNQFPSFLTYDSGRGTADAAYAAQFLHDFRCNAALSAHGCGLEQQLESLYRALVEHDASDRAGNTDPNAGFLRADAGLALIVVSDEEDGSVRDCSHARAGEACSDARGVFDPSSTAWSSADLNLRMYMYQPGGPRDPTWPLDRYIDPHDPTRGFLSLKPGHPERVLFAAITGVPLGLPMTRDHGIDWDALLGRPDPSNPDDFTRRDSSTAINMMSLEGPISMRQANQDPSCSPRTVPACRREGSHYDPSHPPCTTSEQYYAWPARRLVEVARRFDQARLCYGGVPCHTGTVGSICRDDPGGALSVIAQFVVRQINGG